jgi:hypothetical protein
MSNFMRQQTFRAVVWRRTQRSLTFCAGQPAIAACCSGLEPSAARPVKLIKSGAGTSAAQGRGRPGNCLWNQWRPSGTKSCESPESEYFHWNKNSNETGYFLWNQAHVVLTPTYAALDELWPARLSSATIEIR